MSGTSLPWASLEKGGPPMFSKVTKKSNDVGLSYEGFRARMAEWADY
jgi:hypothetical protein